MGNKSLLIVGLLVMGLVAGCGGGSSSSVVDSGATEEGGSSGNTITITGTVEAPSVASANISKGIAKATVADSAAAAAGSAVEIIQLTEGKEPGMATCDGSGSYTVSVSPDDLKASEDSGEEFTAKLIVHVTTPSNQELYNYIEVTVNAETSTITADKVDSDKSITALELLGQFGIEDFSNLKEALAAKTADIKTRIQSFDPKCYFEAYHQTIAGADITADSGVSDEVAVGRDACKAVMAAGEIPAEYEGQGAGKGWGPFMRDCVKGDLPDEAKTEMGSVIEGAGISSLANWQDKYVTSGQMFGKFDTLFGSTIAGGVGLTAMASTSSIGKAEALTSDPCSSIKDDEEYADKFKELILNAADIDEFDTTFGLKEGLDSEDAMKVMFGTFEQFKTAGDFDKFDPAAMYGMLGSYAGDYSSFMEGGVLVTGALTTVHETFASASWDSFADADSKRAYFGSVGDAFVGQIGNGGNTWDEYKDQMDVLMVQWQGEYESSGSFTPTAPLDSAQVESFRDTYMSGTEPVQVGEMYEHYQEFFGSGDQQDSPTPAPEQPPQQSGIVVPAELQNKCGMTLVGAATGECLSAIQAFCPTHSGAQICQPH